MIHETCKYLANGGTESTAVVSSYADHPLQYHPVVMLEFYAASGRTYHITFKNKEAYRIFLAMLHRMDEKL